MSTKEEQYFRSRIDQLPLHAVRSIPDHVPGSRVRFVVSPLREMIAVGRYFVVDPKEGEVLYMGDKLSRVRLLSVDNHGLVVERPSGFIVEFRYRAGTAERS